MIFHADRPDLTGMLGLAPGRALALNELLRSAFDTHPGPACTADIVAQVAEHLSTPEETFYLGFKIGALANLKP